MASRSVSSAPAYTAALGVQTSFVRSLALDTLTARERARCILNGNEGFGKFLADPSRGVPRRVWLALPLQTRYHTPAADTTEDEGGAR